MLWRLSLEFELQLPAASFGLASTPLPSFGSAAAPVATAVAEPAPTSGFKWPTKEESKAQAASPFGNLSASTGTLL